MGREVYRVPMDFYFPVGESFAQHCFDAHPSFITDQTGRVLTTDEIVRVVEGSK
jgi:hypothetical protein